MGLYEWLSLFEEVYLLSERLTIEQIRNINPAIVISYNYNYIITPDIIEYMNGKIINMHISYLPYNRGASPNVWSFIDDTPKGITIHQVSTGLDKGNIIYQKEYFFNTEKETFASTYEKLNIAIVELFKEHWQEIKTGAYQLKEQVEKGTYHSQKDLIQLQKDIPFEWTDNIAEFLKRYHSISKRKCE